MIQDMGGETCMTGERDEVSGGDPQKVGVTVADLMTGMDSTVDVLSALYERRSSGKGQHNDMALLDTQVAWLANQNTNYLVGGQVPVRVGNAHPNIVPYQTCPTADGNVIVAIGNDAQFSRFCEAADIPELPLDARFRNNATRVANRDACVSAIATATRKKTTSEWIQRLEPLGIPRGPIHSLDHA